LLDHPNIIKLVDHSALDALPQEKEKQYIVMPIAAGGDLSDVACSFKGDVERVLSVALQISEGLQSAHGKNVIHRDLKPENVLLSGNGDEIWISDFGICLIRDGRPRNTRTGEVVGPVIFMAPELEGGGELAVEPDADIYSLGKVMYYLLTGGVRLPREELGDERYAVVLAQPGLEDLRLLLTQMICYRPQRIKTTAVVIERLMQIQQRRQGVPTALSSEGIAALDRLKSDIADEQQKYQREIDAASREADLTDAALASIKALIKAQLDEAAATFRTPGAISADVHEIGPPSPRTIEIRAGKILIMDGLELAYPSRATSPPP
jgi:serine/threonine protein kinase